MCLVIAIVLSVCVHAPLALLFFSSSLFFPRVRARFCVFTRGSVCLQSFCLGRREEEHTAAETPEQTERMRRHGEPRPPVTVVFPNKAAPVDPQVGPGAAGSGWNLLSSHMGRVCVCVCVIYHKNGCCDWSGHAANQRKKNDGKCSFWLPVVAVF